MANLDLGTAAGFARATMSPLSEIIADFTGTGDPALWDIKEGAYNGIKFHIFETKENFQAAVDRITDTGGRRKVKYMFPYRDGQTTDDLGRKPEDYSINILFHGPNYLSAASRFIAECQKPTPGDLIHPILGQVKVAMEDITRIHESKTRKAMAIQVRFIEHNFEVGSFKSDIDTTVKGALAQALAIFAYIDNAIVNIEGAAQFATNIEQSIIELLESLKVDTKTFLGQINVTFNDGESSDIPTLLPVNQGGTDTGFFPSAVSPNDPFASVPLDDESVLSVAIEQTRLEKNLNSRRSEINDIINLMSEGKGALEFYDDILNLKLSAILLQNAFETGVASSRSRIIDYTTPRVMSIREVAFANGLSVDDADQIDVLNPSLLSTNYIEKGTTLKVPVS